MLDCISSVYAIIVFASEVAAPAPTAAAGNPRSKRGQGPGYTASAELATRVPSKKESWFGRDETNNHCRFHSNPFLGQQQLIKSQHIRH